MDFESINYGVKIKAENGAFVLNAAADVNTNWKAALLHAKTLTPFHEHLETF